MASLLRQIVAGPRARHPEAGLDLCYVTDRIIATSGPSGTYPQRAYRNPLDSLVKFLDSKHGENWAIWEFRAEGTGYPDSEVYGRVWHFPWPDHHPPPFALIPNIMASMRNWLKHLDNGIDGDKQRDVAKEEASKVRETVRDKLGKEVHPRKGERVIVVHCKAGKGRSGTIATSYLISEEGWTKEDALKRFTERRMRPGFGSGVSIPSQLRYIDYVVRWTKCGKLYVERQVEICELHLIGLRDGVKVSIEGFVDEGRTIKVFHTFKREERELVRGEIGKSGLADIVSEVLNRKNTVKSTKSKEDTKTSEGEDPEVQTAGADVIYRPTERVVLPSNDINIDFERRNQAVSGFTMVTAVAHVWFNTFFEGKGPEQNGNADTSGVFEIEWAKIDGLKGSSKKGTRAFDKLQLLWKVPEDLKEASILIREPAVGEEVKQSQPADWHGTSNAGHDESRSLGMRITSPTSESVSRASSFREHSNEAKEYVVVDERDEIEGVKTSIPGQSSSTPSVVTSDATGPSQEPSTAQVSGGNASSTLDASSSSDQPYNPPGTSLSTGDRETSTSNGSAVAYNEHISSVDLPGGRSEHELKTAREHGLGHLGHHTTKY